MPPTPATSQTVAPSRRVTFNSKTEVREFGNTEIESVREKKVKRRGMIDVSKYRSIRIDGEDFDPNETMLVEPDVMSKMDLFNDTTTALNGVAAPWAYNPAFKPSKSLHLNPQGEIVRQLKKLSKDRYLMAKKAERKAQSESNSNGVSWRKQPHLQNIRGDWRFDDEMESDGDDPADNEMDFEEMTEQLKERKKKHVLKRERVSRHLAIQQMMEKDKFEKFVLDYIEKLNKGEEAKVIASDGNFEKKEYGLLDNFHMNLQHFNARNTKNYKEINFKVQPFIVRRLKDEDLNSQIRSVYEIILDNYDELLWVNLYFLCKHRKMKEFKALERIFFLGI